MPPHWILTASDGGVLTLGRLPSVGKETLLVQQQEREQKMDKTSHEEGAFQQKDERLNNGHATKNKADKSANQHILKKSRFLLLAYISSSHALVPLFLGKWEIYWLEHFLRKTRQAINVDRFKQWFCGKLTTIDMELRMNLQFYMGFICCCWGQLTVRCMPTVSLLLTMCRSPTPSPRGRPKSKRSSSRSISPSPRFQNDSGNPDRKSGHENRGISLRSPNGSPSQKVPDPSASNRGQAPSGSRSPNGTPKRIRKGRGFTEQFSFARRYRTPSPERSPRRSYNFGGRNFHERNRDR